MGLYRSLASRSPTTFALSVIFLIWFLFQIIVLKVYGEETMHWLFYSIPTEQHFPAIQPGSFVSPFSHSIELSSHLFVNLAVLLTVGILAEPYIGKRRILFFVVVIGFAGTYLVNLTAPIHSVWVIAGASGGIYALLSYSAIRLRYLALQFSPDDGVIELVQREEFVALIILVSLPIILVYEVFVTGNLGHIIGLIIGLLCYPIDRFIYLSH